MSLSLLYKLTITTKNCNLIFRLTWQLNLMYRSVLENWWVLFIINSHLFCYRAVVVLIVKQVFFIEQRALVIHQMAWYCQKGLFKKFRSVVEWEFLLQQDDLTVHCLFSGRSQDFCCETCGCSMRSALLALTANSNPSAEDHKAKELAQQINFKVRTLAVIWFIFDSQFSHLTPKSRQAVDSIS